MPLPVILVGGVVGISLWAGKKFFDAARDVGAAEAINEGAQKTFDDAKRSLERCEEETQNNLKSLGQQKIRLSKDVLEPFVRTFQQIKNVDYEDVGFKDKNLRLSSDDILEIQEVTIRMKEAVGGTAGALGVGLLGTAVLGVSFVAAPVLLFGSFWMASKAEAAKENARANQYEAQAAAEDMKTAEIHALSVGSMANEVQKILKRLQDYLDCDLGDLQGLILINADYRTYNRPQKELVGRTVSLAMTAKNLVEAPLLEKDGSITKAIRETLRESKNFLRRLDET